MMLHWILAKTHNQFWIHSQWVELLTIMMMISFEIWNKMIQQIPVVNIMQLWIFTICNTCYITLRLSKMFFHGEAFLIPCYHSVITHNRLAHLEYRHILPIECPNVFFRWHFVILLGLLVFCVLFRVLFRVLVLFLSVWLDLRAGTRWNKVRHPPLHHITIIFICLKNYNLTINFAFSCATLIRKKSRSCCDYYS